MNIDLQELKKETVRVCRQKLVESHEKITRQISGLKDALDSESKSTAGDKHETGRAMVQLEMERAASRLRLQEEEFQVFERLVYRDSPVANRVAAGSMVDTTAGIYFLSVSLGILKISEFPVMVISPLSPIGQLLLSKSAGDTVTFNGKPIGIRAVV
ncbi:GreA/GreB family elongation factor [Robertkochia flava]|uniref:GreA/GreB family elongation factor n=1 Tax=Robertkochia flava TaxID=3447986 RepID=UPI001CCBFAE4|nr:GreA/GreB family elongation factor [Robertkochia marina]